MVKIKFLFNFQHFYTIMVAKPLATKKKYFIKFYWVNEPKIEKKLGLIPWLKKSKFYKKIPKIQFLFNF